MIGACDGALLRSATAVAAVGVVLAVRVHQYLTAIIESYETEQARVCADFPQCSDDGGVYATFADTEEDLAGGDGNHLTTAGQARTAALLWPVVAGILGY